MKDITRHTKTQPRIRHLSTNCIEIQTSYGKYVTSYDSAVVFIPNDESVIYLGDDWDYSSTTFKHIKLALNLSTPDIRARLKDGTAKLLPS